jgi:hypothetical protein
MNQNQADSGIPLDLIRRENALTSNFSRDCWPPATARLLRDDGREAILLGPPRFGLFRKAARAGHSSKRADA